MINIILLRAVRNEGVLRAIQQIMREVDRNHTCLALYIAVRMIYMRQPEVRGLIVGFSVGNKQPERRWKKLESHAYI